MQGAYGWTDELLKAQERLRRMGYRVNRLENGDFALGMGDRSALLTKQEIIAIAPTGDRWVSGFTGLEPSANPALDI